jgi:hypothetical protein
MKKSILKLVKKAGFTFWGNESWGPGKNKVDWSSNYDNELEKFSKLIVEKCISICNENQTKTAKEIALEIKLQFKK